MKSKVALASIMLAASALIGTSAQAANVFSDNFDTTNGGATALNFTGFNDFTVTAGAVDLVGTPNGFGITCAGATGACVDLDGSPGPGTIQSTAIGFGAGQTVTLSFDLAQSQRNDLANSFFAGINFSGATDISTVSLGGGFGASSGSGGSLVSILENGSVSNPNFTNYTISFTANQAGSFTAQFGTTDQGNIGALLDNVTVDVSAIPEPASWAMLLLGFFGIGSMVRLDRGRSSIASAV